MKDMQMKYSKFYTKLMFGVGIFLLYQKNLIGLLCMIGLIGVHLCIKSESQFSHLGMFWRTISQVRAKAGKWAGYALSGIIVINS